MVITMAKVTSVLILFSVLIKYRRIMSCQTDMICHVIIHVNAECRNDIHYSSFHAYSTILLLLELKWDQIDLPLLLFQMLLPINVFRMSACILYFHCLLQIKQETDEFVHEREQKTRDLELRQRRDLEQFDLHSLTLGLGAVADADSGDSAVGVRDSSLSLLSTSPASASPAALR